MAFLGDPFERERLRDEAREQARDERRRRRQDNGEDFLRSSVYGEYEEERDALPEEEDDEYR